MDIFVTGASGFIGSAVASVLVARGHHVRGLARSEGAAAAVRATGAEPVRGSLADLEILTREAAAAGGVVHTAGTSGPEQPAVNARAVDALLAGMRGGAFLLTSAGPVARSSRVPVGEDDVAGAGGPLAWLVRAEAQVLTAPTARGLVLRPPMVYGDGRGPVAGLVAAARAAGAARYIGDGQNMWSMVHVRDLAVAYALLVESRAAGVFHAAETVPTRMRELFTAIAEAAAVPVRAWSLEEALAAQGPLAAFLMADAALDAAKLRALGWTPQIGEALGGVVGSLLHPTQGYRTAA